MTPLPFTQYTWLALYRTISTWLIGQILKIQYCQWSLANSSRALVLGREHKANYRTSGRQATVLESVLIVWSETSTPVACWRSFCRAWQCPSSSSLQKVAQNPAKGLRTFYDPVHLLWRDYLCGNALETVLGKHSKPSRNLFGTQVLHHGISRDVEPSQKLQEEKVSQ